MSGQIKWEISGLCCSPCTFTSFMSVKEKTTSQVTCEISTFTALKFHSAHLKLTWNASSAVIVNQSYQKLFLVFEIKLRYKKQYLMKNLNLNSLKNILKCWLCKWMEITKITKT